MHKVGRKSESLTSTASTQVVLSRLRKSVSAMQTALRALRKEKDEQARQMAEQRVLLEKLLQNSVAHPTASAQSATPTKHVSGAQAALQAMRHRLESQTAFKSITPQTTDVSEATKHEWALNGRIVGWAELANAWGDRSRQSLDQASARGELFSLKVAGKRLYPSVFLHLSAESVKAINLPLKDVDPVSKLIFWNRTHGALGNKTLAEAIEGGQLDRAVHLAQAFADEYLGHAEIA